MASSAFIAEKDVFSFVSPFVGK